MNEEAEQEMQRDVERHKEFYKALATSSDSQQEETMEDKTNREIAREFVEEKNMSNVDGQFKMIVEEVGELSEALNTEDRENVEEELADVLITVRMLEHMSDDVDDLDAAYREKMKYNFQKSGEKVGSKLADDVESDD